MREKALNLLGLMRKANALRLGEEDTGSAVREHEAKLVLLASDASQNAQKRAAGYMYGSKAPLITVPFTKEEISGHVGKSGCSMAAVCDIGFAGAFMKLLCDISPMAYGDAAQTIQRRALESKMRKNDSTRQKNKRTGKRRTNA
jgi:ribosomal protein L7Ae-like RNA K-turn-binding protein